MRNLETWLILPWKIKLGDIGQADVLWLIWLCGRKLRARRRLERANGPRADLLPSGNAEWLLVRRRLK